jgi:predicted nucleic acid-binding protein
MRVFFDSSSFVKRFIEEAGSQDVEDICQDASSLGLSIICLPEIISALNRKKREGNLDKGSYLKIKYQLLEDIRDIQIIQLLPEVVEKTVFLLESNSLRSLDALHVACAIEWYAELFVSSDKKQILAAKKAGLTSRYIGA